MNNLSVATGMVDDDDAPITQGRPTNDDRGLLARYGEIAQLVGGLAHEIRNPLSTMGLNLDLLAEEFPNPETTRDKRIVQKLQRVRKETRRLQDILEDFLRFARVHELRLQRVALDRVVDDMGDFCEPQCLVGGIVPRIHHENAGLLVELDTDLFKQALLNLILNAQNAMPDGGELILRTRTEGPWVILDVIDTGCGMDLQTAARAFEPFFSTRSGGSGLGLPTTRKMVEAHGGSVSLRTEPGLGSQFTVRLPKASDEHQEARGV